jgi:hypothetical protein
MCCHAGMSRVLLKSECVPDYFFGYGVTVAFLISPEYGRIIPESRVTQIMSDFIKNYNPISSSTLPEKSLPAYNVASY